MGEWEEKTKLQKKKKGKIAVNIYWTSQCIFDLFKKKNATIAVNSLTGNVQF